MLRNGNDWNFTWWTHTQSNLCLKSLNSQLLLLHHLRQTFSSTADDNDDNISTEISQECQKRLKITQTAPAALQWEPGAATASETYRRGEQPRKNRGPKLQVSWPHGPTVVVGGRIASERHSAKFFCVRHQSGFANKFVDFNANPNTDHAAVDEMTYVVRTSG